MEQAVPILVQNADSSPTQQVDTTYTPDGQVATLTAVNATTGNQVTEYTYGVTPTDSEIASNDLLAQVTYPDNSGGDGIVAYEYNRQGQRIEMTDQNGTVHEYAYDKLGRQTLDKATAGTGVDDDVKRIVWSYDNRKRLAHVTSYNTTSGTSGVTSVVQNADSSARRHPALWLERKNEYTCCAATRV